MYKSVTSAAKNPLAQSWSHFQGLNSPPPEYPMSAPTAFAIDDRNLIVEANGSPLQCCFHTNCHAASRVRISQRRCPNLNPYSL